MGNGEEAARTLWQETGIRVLPGGYVAASDGEGMNASDPYIRVALVHDNKTIDAALQKLASVL